VNYIKLNENSLKFSSFTSPWECFLKNFHAAFFYTVMHLKNNLHVLHSLDIKHNMLLKSCIKATETPRDDS